MDDLISRQDAIDAADEIIKRDTSGNNDVVKVMTAWKCYIQKLPTAQPEIIRCKDCKWRYETEHNGKRFMVCDFMDCQMKDDDFCSRAERRTG